MGKNKGVYCRMRNYLLSKVVLICALFLFAINNASASMLYFNPVGQTYTIIGETLTYDLYANIDAKDAIMGFGFDLSFNGGTSSVSGPGAYGDYLTFDSFTGNSDYFYYNALFDDGDTINGWRAFFDPDISGTGIRLGTFTFTTHATGGIETITLLADDLGPLGTEGLVQGKVGGVAFLPNIATATATSTTAPVPEPATCLLFLCGLVGAVGIKKKIC